jgi:glycosyltransferase involved in cell wall biosynthesis
VRVLIDYRAALKDRTGVGEYTHQLVRALARRRGQGTDVLDLTIFSSSAKDRLHPLPELDRVRQVDRRLPVRLLNLAWHRLEWPSVETLTGQPYDVAHSLHPLLMPARAAAQVVTIHDLNFLKHPERTRAEIRRDYPGLARAHAHRADQVIVVSEFTAREVQTLFDVPREQISICSPGAPPWAARTTQPGDGYLLFFGTLEPRKNVGALLDAYELLLSRRPSVPDLLLAGKATEQSRPWLERIARPPLSKHVRHVGYIAPAQRQALYEGACVLVQPSFEEGFGLPVLEAMTAGVPVVAADAGALPEVGGEAILLASPESPASFADAIEQLLGDPASVLRCVERGVRRAAYYSWDRTAQTTLEAYERALARRVSRQGAA